jgi:hypothetical protein
MQFEVDGSDPSFDEPFFQVTQLRYAVIKSQKGVKSPFAHLAEALAADQVASQSGPHRRPDLAHR